MDNNEDFIVSKYTDNDAVEDGVLVDLTNGIVDGVTKINDKSVNRITDNAFNKLGLDFILEQSKDDPEGKQVEASKVLAFQVINNLASSAKDDDGDGYLLTSETANGDKYWFVLNDVNGYTLLLPEDY